MKAAIYKKIGSHNSLSIKEVAKSVPADQEILIEIICSSVSGGNQQ